MLFQRSHDLIFFEKRFRSPGVGILVNFLSNLGFVLNVFSDVNVPKAPRVQNTQNLDVISHEFPGLIILEIFGTPPYNFLLLHYTRWVSLKAQLSIQEKKFVIYLPKKVFSGFPIKQFFPPRPTPKFPKEMVY